MEGDELAWVKMTSGDENLLVATRRGKAICFNENDVRPMGRTARGVRAIKMDDGDEVVGMARMVEGGTVLTVTETGFGRRSNLSDYRVQTRGGKGLLNYRTSVYGDVAAIRVVDDSDDIIMISSNGIVIRIPVSEIATHMRPAKGVRVMRLVDDPDGEPVRLVSLTKVAHDENEIDEHEIEEDEDSGDVGAAETEEAEDNDAGED